MTDQDQLEVLIAEFARSGLRELHVRSSDFELYLSTDPTAGGIAIAAARPNPAATAARPAKSPELAATASPLELMDGATVIRAPNIGTFYRAPKPGAEVYVEVGSIVSAETEVCLIEVMKLFTAVRAGTSGRINSILADDGAMVAADQPLFAIVAA